MKILDIVFDTDGVKGDWVGCVLAKYNAEYGMNLTKGDIITGNWTKLQIPNTDILKYIYDKSVYEEMKPYEEAQQLIRDINELNHRIFACTAVPKVVVENRANWIGREFPEIDESRYMFTSDKSLVAGDVFIDDGVHNLVACKAKVKILLSRPWNQNVSEKYKEEEYEEAISNIIRVKEESAYSDIFNIIMEISKGNKIDKTKYLTVFKEELLNEEKRLA